MTTCIVILLLLFYYFQYCYYHHYYFQVQTITVKHKVDIKNHYIHSIPTISSLNLKKDQIQLPLFYL